MPIIQLPSGEWVVQGDAPQAELDVVAQDGYTMASNRASRPSGTSRKEVSEAQKRADATTKAGLGQGAFARMLTQGATFNFADEIGGAASAATKGVYNAVTKGDIGEIGKEYTTARDTQRILDAQAKQDSPLLSTVGEIGGAVANPLGTGSKLVGGAAKLAGKAGLEGVASALGSGAAKLASTGPLASAVISGANQGALNAAGSATDLANVPDALATGAGFGGAFGLAGGAVAKGASAVAHAVRDRAASSAERLAFEKAGQRLEQGRTTPADAEAQLAQSRADGVDARFMDTTHGTRADAAFYSRKPGLDASNDLKDVGEARMSARPNNIVTQVEKNADIPASGTDSDALIEKVVADRKAQGKADYAIGGALDAPVNWSKDLDDFWAKAPKDTNSAMLRARSEIEGRRGDPDAYMKINDDGTKTIVPSMRSFDYLKRGFDGEIGVAKAAGDMPKVQRLQGELGEFKRLFGEANDTNEYAQLLLRQRTGFERQAATEQAQGWLRRLTSNDPSTGPRQILKEIKALKPHEVEDARSGILDGLLNVDNRANPLGTFKSLMRNEKQKEVLAFAFGGKDKLEGFNRYLRSELKAAAADGVVSGPQSITGALKLSSEEGSEGAAGIFNQVLRGYAFGGIAGTAAAGYRSFQNAAGGMGKEAQEAYGRLLAGDGEGLAKGVESARQFGLKRADRVTRRARGFAKGAQQIPTDYLGKK